MPQACTEFLTSNPQNLFVDWSTTPNFSRWKFKRQWPFKMPTRHLRFFLLETQKAIADSGDWFRANQSLRLKASSIIGPTLAERTQNCSLIKIFLMALRVLQQGVQHLQVTEDPNLSFQMSILSKKLYYSPSLESKF